MLILIYDRCSIIVCVIEDSNEPFSPRDHIRMIKKTPWSPSSMPQNQFKKYIKYFFQKRSYKNIKSKYQTMKLILFLSLSLISKAFDPTILMESEFNAFRKFLKAKVKDTPPTKRGT